MLAALDCAVALAQYGLEFSQAVQIDRVIHAECLIKEASPVFRLAF